MSQIINDPNIVAKLAAQIDGQPAKVIESPVPPSTSVELPSGWVYQGTVLRDAVVRELTGVDEEAIAREAGNSGKALMTVLRRGLVSIGGVQATEDMLDSLLVGDRDALLLAIYAVTFGESVVHEALCQSCGSGFVVETNVLTDVPTKIHNDPASDRVFEVETRKGKVVAGLPTGVTQKRILENPSSNSAETITTILAGCIISIDGAYSYGPDMARSLGIGDREAIVKEIFDRTPGPRLGEVTKVCEACGSEYVAPLNLAALFRL